MCYMGTAKRMDPEASGDPEDVLSEAPLVQIPRGPAFRGAQSAEKPPPSAHTHTHTLSRVAEA